MLHCKKLCRGLIQVALVVLIALNVAVIFSQYESEEDLLDGIPFGVLEVTGGSMEPYLSPGDGIFVYETPFEQIKPQDTVLFVQDGALITHRVQSVETDYFITRGTANDIEDSPVAREDYRAKVIFSIPYLSVILVFYENPFYFAIFAVVFFFFIFGSSLAAELYERIEEMRRLAPYEEEEDTK